jgi:CTP:molybdopterin cytidylyltransferase MocA
MKNNKPTLVILAAGMGSRYGGLQQMDTFTPEGDTIMDFSLSDAIQAGFGKVVFIIRKSLESDFKNLFNDKLMGKIEIEYVFQEVENVPKEFINEERVNLGEQATLC